MNIFMVFHHELMPEVKQEPFRYKCGCGRTIFKANANNMTVSNDIGMGWDTFQPGQKVIELVCHSCKNKYKILFQ